MSSLTVELLVTVHSVFLYPKHVHTLSLRNGWATFMSGFVTLGIPLWRMNNRSLYLWYKRVEPWGPCCHCLNANKNMAGFKLAQTPAYHMTSLVLEGVRIAAKMDEDADDMIVGGER